MSESESISGNKGGKKWWPHMVIILSLVMLVVALIIGIMADRFPVPDDAPNEIPFPDDGENVPGPEWLFLLFWLPFWYFKGHLKKYLFLTSVVPIVIFLYFMVLPYFHKIPLHRIPGLKVILEKVRGMTSGMKKSLIYALPALIFGVIMVAGVYRSGHQAKVLGCDACHNPAMGHRMAIPPVNVATYYTVDRARQIGSAKYRAGKSTGLNAEGEMMQDTSDDEGGYKDANWQMRHMYEPTFTW